MASRIKPIVHEFKSEDDAYIFAVHCAQKYHENRYIAHCGPSQYFVGTFIQISKLKPVAPLISVSSTEKRKQQQRVMQEIYDHWLKSGNVKETALLFNTSPSNVYRILNVKRTKKNGTGNH